MENNRTMIRGQIPQFFLKVSGEIHICSCGCNVFHKPDKNCPNIYKCNCCDYTIEGGTVNES